MVSHDREFLNKTINAIFEIDEYDHTLKKYEGNYDMYIQAKKAERLHWEEEHERQQEELAELRKRVKETARQVGHGYRPPRDNDKNAAHFFAQRVDSTIARNIRAAEEQLKRLEADLIPKPPELLRVSSHFQGNAIESREVLRISSLRKSWGERNVLCDVSFTVTHDAHIVIFGPNGAGKQRCSS